MDREKLCPRCKNPLSKGKSKRYETLSEHVLNPNKYLYYKPPLRPTLKCNNGCYPRRHFFDPYIQPKEYDYYLPLSFFEIIKWKIKNLINSISN